MKRISLNQSNRIYVFIAVCVLGAFALASGVKDANVFASAAKMSLIQFSTPTRLPDVNLFTPQFFTKGSSLLTTAPAAIQASCTQSLLKKSQSLPFATTSTDIRIPIVEDFNKDGNLDFVSVYYTNSSTVAEYYVGDGTGNLRLQTRFSVPDGTWSLVSGDINGDGKKDLVALGHGNFTVLLNQNGTGFSASAAIPFPVAREAFSIKIDDMNGDGRADVILSQPGPFYFNPVNTLYLRNANGSFTSSTLGFANGTPALTGDFNGDGKADVLAAELNYPSNQIWLGNGAGQFTKGEYIALNTYVNFYGLVDYNRDGSLDLIGYTSTDRNNNYTAESNRFVAFLNNGRGNFTSKVSQLSNEIVYFGSIGDFNKDGLPDVMMTNTQVLINDGLGGICVVEKPFNGPSILGVTAGDFDKDGKSDAVVTSISYLTSLGGEFSVWLNNGTRQNTLPTITSVAPLTLAYGSTQTIQIATVSDQETPVDQLRLVLSNASDLSSYLSITNIKNVAGKITATITVRSDFILDPATSINLGLSLFDAEGAGAFAYLNISFTQQTQNTPPTITPFNNSTLFPALEPITLAVATVNDTETPVGNLTVTATKVPAGLTVGQITNDNGTIRAIFNIACNATTGANTIEFTVTDGGGATAKTNVTLNLGSVIPQLTVPASITIGQGLSTIFETPYSGFDITVTIPGFTGKIVNSRPASFYPNESNWGLIDAGPPGQYTVTVTTQTRSTCSGSVITKTFSLTVTGASASCVYPTFQAGKEFTAKMGRMTFADFNKDGKTDLIYSDNAIGGSVATSPNILLRLGLGNGDFAAPLTLASFPGVGSIKTADLNGDGNLDVAVSGATLSVIYGNGQNGALSVYNSTEKISSIEQIADLNKDGRLDIVGMDEFYNFGPQAAYQRVTSLINKGANTFVKGTVPSISYPKSALLLDYDLDGSLDLLVSSFGGNSLIKGDGQGNFSGAAIASPSSPLLPAGYDSFLYNIGDLNLDGKTDYASTVGYPDAPYSQVNNGFLSVLGQKILGFDSYGFSAPLTPARYNADLYPDLGRFFNILINNGQGGFCAAPKYPFNVSNSVDLNGDNLSDVVEVTATGFKVWLNTTGGTTNTPPTITMTASSVSQGVSGAVPAFGTVADAQTPASNLQLTATNVPAGVTLTNLRSVNGAVNADIAVTCGAATGTYQIPIKVTDGGGLTATANWTLFINANEAPLLGTYANTTVTGSSSNITPSRTPGDDGTIANLTATASSYTGNISISATGMVTITNNNVAGTYPVTIRATDNCGLSTQTTFTFTIPPSTGCPSPTFGTPLNYNSNTQPYSIATADFNGDQLQDMAVVNGGADTITILMRQTDGSFIKNSATYAVGPWANFVMTSDFNGDGKFDFAVTNKSSDLVTIFLGAGNGTFTKKGGYAIGNKSTGGAVGDFNNDGKPDLMISNDGQGTVVLLINNGDGSFKAPKQFGFNVFDAPQPGVVRDFNKDGNLDIAIPLYNSGLVAIMRGDGLGNFNTLYFQTNLIGIGPIAGADFNGDVNDDLIVVGGNSLAVTLLGNGNGTFVNAGNFATGGNNVSSIAVDDYNNDGKKDLAVAGYSDSVIRVFKGVGNGTFVVNSPTLINVGSHPLGLVNLYSAAKASLAVANNGSGTVSVIPNGCSQ